tara:strand:+ start:1486 stop:1620 length:135 start_codon:yes stop_codon:yes gene_type:complete
MIPMELISMGASTILGGVLSIMAQKGKDAAEAQNMTNGKSRVRR